MPEATLSLIAWDPSDGQAADAFGDRNVVVTDSVGLVAPMTGPARTANALEQGREGPSCTEARDEPMMPTLASALRDRPANDPLEAWVHRAR